MKISWQVRLILSLYCFNDDLVNNINKLRIFTEKYSIIIKTGKNYIQLIDTDLFDGQNWILRLLHSNEAKDANLIILGNLEEIVL